MRVLLIILFFSSKIFAQSDSIVWKTNNEIGVVSYDVQQSLDKNNWANLGNIKPAKKDSNIYAYPLSAINYYYRIKSNMISNFYVTTPLLLTSTLAVDIINVILQSNPDYLTLYFTSENESNINYYEIDQSLDNGQTIKDILHIPPKGNGDYSVTINRPTTQVTSCGAKIFGWCLWKHLKTVIDSRPEIIYIYLVSNDGNRTLLKAQGE